MGLQPFYGKRPHPLLWVDLQAAHRKITVIGTPHELNYCEIFTAYAKFTNVPAGNIIQLGGRGLNTHELNKH
jgi:hypothetical protein